jgi:hypothetical protein
MDSSRLVSSFRKSSSFRLGSSSSFQYSTSKNASGQGGTGLSIQLGEAGFNSNGSLQVSVGKRSSAIDISPPNHKRTNDASGPDGLHINPRGLHSRSYLPSHYQSHLVYSSVDWKWRANEGKELDVALHGVVHDKMNRPKSGCTKKKRQIDLTCLAHLLWMLMSFVYSCRHLKTRAEALVRCMFRVLAKEYPELFKDVLIQECRNYIRQHVTHAYKFQRTIDTQPTGGLNYGSIEGI